MQKDEALALVLQVLHTVDVWVQRLTDPEDNAVADPVLAVAKQVQEQNVQISEEGKESLIKGVAKDRQLSVEDERMHYGCKSRSVQVDGCKFDCLLFNLNIWVK
jgi:hypothetical protein